jgi:hypothetical protein
MAGFGPAPDARRGAQIGGGRHLGNLAMIKIAAVAAGTLMLTSAQAAEISVVGPGETSMTIIAIAGQINAGDEDVFSSKVKGLDPEKTAVALASEGGTFRPALVIANHIRLTGMSTLVPAGRTCASSCAYIWLAGRVRMLDTDARVGFHGTFDARSGVPASQGNALLGTFLGHLGFGYDMVDWVVSAPAGTMHWLTPETAKRYGIDYQVLTPERAPQPPPSTQKRDAQIHKQVQVIEDLQLREQPDPRARNILGAPPDDKMPKGSQVAVIDTCRTWMGSGRGAQDADNIWCPVLYEGHRGWANAYFLADHGERVACVMYPTARGCASTAGR